MYDITRQDSFVRVTEWLQNIEKVRMSGSQLYRSSDKDPCIAQGFGTSLYWILYLLQKFCCPIRLQNAQLQHMTFGENSRLCYLPEFVKRYVSTQDLAEVGTG